VAFYLPGNGGLVFADTLGNILKGHPMRKALLNPDALLDREVLVMLIFQWYLLLRAQFLTLNATIFSFSN
jgi:hypothetical protein